MNTTKPRKKLNQQQLEVLTLLYKFRFGSNDLFAQYFGRKDRSFAYKRLSILLERDLIGKRFESSYRLQGKPAAYYIKPAGVRALQQHFPDKAYEAKAIYKDKTVSDDFIQYCLHIFSLYLHFKQNHEDVRFFTKAQLTNYDNLFTDFIPSIYFRFNDGETVKNYFLEYAQNSKPFFKIMQQIKRYIAYCESAHWETETETDFPVILIVCDQQALQNRLLKRTRSLLDDIGPKVYITTHSDLKSDRDDAWLSLNEPDQKATLCLF